MSIASTQDDTATEGCAPATGSGVAVVDSEKVFGIKSPCPYCGGKITASANAWEEDDEGRFYATDLDISCSNEPDIDDEEAWKSWDIEHGRGDYNEAWHQLHERIVRSMKAKVRFNLQNARDLAPPPQMPDFKNDAPGGC